MEIRYIIKLRLAGESKMKIRRFQQEDAIETSGVIAKTLKISNSKDYPKEYIEANIVFHSAEILIERAKEGQCCL